MELNLTRLSEESIDRLPRVHQNRDDTFLQRSVLYGNQHYAISNICSGFIFPSVHDGLMLPKGDVAGLKIQHIYNKTL